jgi:hypothetical protein
LSIDPEAATLNATTEAATAAIQTLSDALQSAAFSQHKLLLPPIWLQGPVGWFQHVEAEFTPARLPANSYISYIDARHHCPLTRTVSTVKDALVESWLHPW